MLHSFFEVAVHKLILDIKYSEINVSYSLTSSVLDIMLILNVSLVLGLIGCWVQLLMV